MDDETRAAFGRIERWFELSQAQHLDLRQSTDAQFADLRRGMDKQFAEVRQDIASLTTRLSAFYDEFFRFRDWVVEQFADIRRKMRGLPTG